MDLLKRELLLVEGVAKISTYGERVETIYIELERDRMAQLGISPSTIADELRQKNAVVDAGRQDLMFVSVHKDKDLVDGSSITKILATIENAEVPVVLIGDLNITPGDPRLERIEERFIDTATVRNSENAKQARSLGTFQSGRRIVEVVVVPVMEAQTARADAPSESQISASIEYTLHQYQWPDNDYVIVCGRHAREVRFRYPE